MQNPTNAFVSFGLLIAVVGGSFYFVADSIPPKPWTGITQGLFLNPVRSQALDLERDQGLLIFTIIEGSPADVAGLRGSNDTIMIEDVQVPIGGDIIVSMDDTQISTVEDICTVMDLKRIGDSVRFEVERDGELRQLDATLEELPPGASSIC